MSEPKKEQRIVICAIDTETTNIDCTKAHAVEVTFLPLTDRFDIDESKSHLTTLINPGQEELDKGKEALSFNKISVEEILKGVPSNEFITMLEIWMEKNNIDQIMPLGQNYGGYDSIVLKRLLGFDNYERLINRRYKDSYMSASYINDVFSFNGLKRPFPKTSLGELARYFDIDSNGAHRSYADCVMTAKVYKKLIEKLAIVLS